LDPERAFQPRVRLKDGKTAEVKFEIVPGYYLYRSRIRVEGYSAAALSSPKGRAPISQAPAAPSLMATRMPQGKFVDDPTFGHVEIFDRSVTFDVDLDLAPPSATKSTSTVATRPAAKFVVTSQGCAAAGVCFPPQQHEFALPATVSPSRGSAVAENPWVLPLGGATSLGFGRPKAPAASSIGR
jgi:thiol:disulfide interchange protein DsbD